MSPGTETQLVCPITSRHGASFQSHWHESGRMVGFKCPECGEFSIAPGTGQARIAQFDDAQRERLSAAIREIWNVHRVAPRLDPDAIDRLVGVASGTPELKALAEWFRAKRAGRD
jgi:hypothetical protein